MQIEINIDVEQCIIACSITGLREQPDAFLRLFVDCISLETQEILVYEALFLVDGQPISVETKNIYGNYIFKIMIRYLAEHLAEVCYKRLHGQFTRTAESSSVRKGVRDFDLDLKKFRLS